MNMNAPGSISEKSITENGDGDMVIPVIGVPFSGPVEGNLDLHGDYFDKSTDLGPLDTVMAFWDHGHDESYMRGELKSLGYSETQIDAFGKDFGFGRRHIGIAQRAETTDEGVIYNVIVNRRAKYFKVLERAAKEGLLSVSSKAIHRVDDPDNPGHIKYWALAAVDFTPTPANPEAKLLLKSLMEDEMQGEEEEVVQTSSEPVPTEAEQPQTQTPITDAVRAVEKADDPDSEADPADETSEDEGGVSASAKSAEVELVKSFGERMDALEEKLERVEALFGKIEKAINSVETNTSKAIKDMNDDLQIAIPELARQITGSLRNDVRQEVRKSRAETKIETEKSAVASSRVHKPEVAAAISNWPGA